MHVVARLTGCFALALSCCSAHASQAAAQHPVFVVLIQNSGWMEPFFGDNRAEKFDRLVGGFISRVVPEGAPVVVASFNREGDIANAASPQQIYRGPANTEAIASALSSIQLARRPGGRLANSDYHEALINAITRLLNRQPGLIFMITNNKSAPVGAEQIEDSQVASRTEAFNDMLEHADAVPRVVAWPVPLRVRSRFAENGLVIYGVAYGESTAGLLKELSEKHALRDFFGDPPVRLKPLALDPLVLSLTPGNTKDVKWYADRLGNLYIDGISGGGHAVDMSGSLTNIHYPYVIHSAQLIASWDTPSGAATVTTDISPASVADLQPFDSVNNVSIVLRLISARRERLLQDHRYLPGVLSIRLANLKLGLSPAYVRKMQDLFGNGAKPEPGVPDALPAQTPQIFLNYTGVDHGMTRVPLTLGVHFFPWPLLLMIGGALAAVVPIVLLLWFATRESGFPVPIEGEIRNIGLRPFQSKEVHGVSGVYVVSRGAFGVGAPKLKQ